MKLADYFQEDIISLYSEKDEKVDFLVIAVLEYDEGEGYCILQPVELPLGMQDDEALVFKVKCNSDGSLSYNLVVDDEEMNAVFEDYYRTLDEEPKD